MNLKKITLITLLLLVIVSISAVSATDDADAFAADETVDEQVIESCVDESDDIFSDPNPSDFNGVVKDEIDINDNSPVVTFDWPDYVKEFNSSSYVNDYVKVDVEGGSGPTFYKDPGQTSKEIHLEDLYIFDTGVYNITVSYNDNLEIVKGTLNVTESGSQSYTAVDFIEAYDVSYNYPVDGLDGYVCTFSDSKSGVGLNGEVSLFINGNRAYYKKFTGTGLIASTIYGGNLTGNYNGIYPVKLVYKRSADGKEYIMEINMEFINMVGSDPIPTSIDASAMSVVYNQNKYLVATLKDSNGKAISGVDVMINIMGVSYPLKTDAKGQIKQSLSNLPPKIHTITLTFNGDSNHAKSSKMVKVTVKKATPKITAKAKTFKKSVKSKKYSITLKNNLNKVMKKTKVTIKVNKKTYSAKTNNKGVAIFKITKLTKKGKYTATVKYAGDSYYASKSVKVKITVK